MEIDKDMVRRVLAKQYRPGPGADGPSWLTFIGHKKDGLWSVDLFRCESITLKTHWVLVVMDQFTRRIIGFGIQTGAVDGIALCRMFNHAIVRQGVPRHLSSDNDPLFDFHRWKANLRVLDVDELKTVPYTPTSHPFAERLMGTIRREYLDNVFLWNTVDLEKTVGIQCLLQPISPSQLSGWPNASQSQRGTRQYAYGAPPFPLANSLPRAIRAAGGRLIINSPPSGS